MKVTKLITKIKEMFSLDLRSLALLRISVGIIGLADVILRSRDLVAHYTDNGVLPRATLMQSPHFNNLFGSVNFISGLWQFQVLIFILSAVFFISLILGYKTRWSTLLALIFITSIQIRNPLVFQKSDDVLRLILLWGFFLPWGSVYSVDSSKRQPVKNQSNNIFSVATFAYFIQIMLIYITAALLKSSPIWHQEGSAIFYALSNDQYTSALGYFLLSFPSWALQLLTHCVWWFELLGAFLLILPIFNSLFRIIGVILFVALQIGFGSTMHLEIFPWISVAAMLAFIPSIFWQKMYQYLPFKKQREFILYYDGTCGFCKKSIIIFKIFLFLPDMEMVAAQQDPQIFKEMEDKNSWIVARGAERFYRFDAFLALLSASAIFWPLEKLSKLRGINMIGEKLYNIIADRRKKTCPAIIPVPPKPFIEKFSPIILQLIAAFFLFIVAFSNMGNITNGKITLPKNLVSVGYVFGLNQRWDMFAPYPISSSYWYIMPGRLQDNSTIDVFNNEPVSWNKPKSIAGTADSRWRNYLLQVFSKQNSFLYLPFGNYMCQKWNSSHLQGKQISSFQVFAMSRQNVFNQPPPPYEPTLLWQYRCPAVLR